MTILDAANAKRLAAGKLRLTPKQASALVTSAEAANKLDTRDAAAIEQYLTDAPNPEQEQKP